MFCDCTIKYVTNMCAKLAHYKGFLFFQFFKMYEVYLLPPAKLPYCKGSV